MLEKIRDDLVSARLPARKQIVIILFFHKGILVLVVRLVLLLPVIGLGRFEANRRAVHALDAKKQMFEATAFRERHVAFANLGVVVHATDAVISNYVHRYLQI